MWLTLSVKANFIKHVSYGALFAICSVLVGYSRADEGQEEQIDCFFSFYVGDRLTPVVVCDKVDPLRIADNQTLLRVLRYLKIDPGLVDFRGCDKSVFFVTPVKEGKYVLNYPADIQQEKVLAPLVHELMHVAQMQTSPGMVDLVERLGSLQVELEADYLTGIIYQRLFPDHALKEFEQNLMLTGLYYETSTGAHGTPEQRITAFRRGVNHFDSELNVKKLRGKFEDDIYGEILANTGSEY